MVVVVVRGMADDGRWMGWDERWSCLGAPDKRRHACERLEL
jgi:hypothetical protein